jgi:anti-sigma factor RsiW
MASMISKGDWEVLSAYLDGELSARERALQWRTFSGHE